MAKKTDLTKKKDADLIKDMATKRESLRVSRFSLGADGKNVKAVRDLRNEIAQIKTELNRRARQADAAPVV